MHSSVKIFFCGKSKLPWDGIWHNSCHQQIQNNTCVCACVCVKCYKGCRPNNTIQTLGKTMSMVYARESSSVTLTCKLGVSALFNYNVSWLFRLAQSMFPTATTPTTDPNYSLILYNVSLSDSRVYQCRVTAIAFPDNVYLPSSQQHESWLGATVNLTVEEYGTTLSDCYVRLLGCKATVECCLIRKPSLFKWCMDGIIAT